MILTQGKECGQAFYSGISGGNMEGSGKREQATWDEALHNLIGEEIEIEGKKVFVNSIKIQNGLITIKGSEK